ncbi:hypothetical protein BASA83_011107 [Batrachochytrium salamandrivorans]|nr:hypothetical protein BASA83_011107 [Batrachochytrium salamandrivorans]
MLLQIVQGNPARFKLDRAQIDSRKQFVLESRRGIEDMRSNVNNPGAARMGGGERNAREFTWVWKKKNRQSQQQSLMREQDEQMDDVAVTVGNLREVARVMGDELDDQTRLLGEVEIQVDSTQNKLADGMKRMQDFIRANSDSRQQYCIAVLVVILVILLVLVISFLEDLCPILVMLK